MKKTLTVLGSTGSIGTQTMEAAELLKYDIIALTGNKNTSLMERQARKFSPKTVAKADENCAADLKVRLADTPVRVLSGASGVCEAASAGADGAFIGGVLMKAADDESQLRRVLTSYLAAAND